MKQKVLNALEDLEGYVRVEKQVIKPTKALVFIHHKGKRSVLKVCTRAQEAKLEAEELKRIDEQLEPLEHAHTPKVNALNQDKNYLLMSYEKGEPFEKVYVKELGILHDNHLLKKQLTTIAQSLAMIHKSKEQTRKTDDLPYIPKHIQRALKQEVLVPVHGDFNTENVLCNEEEVTILDPSTTKERGLIYYDLAHFIHHLRFKIPLKYHSLRALMKGKMYEEYFLREYSKASKKNINKQILDAYKYYNFEQQKILITKSTEGIAQQLFKPLIIALCNINILLLQQKLKEKRT